MTGLSRRGFLRAAIGALAGTLAPLSRLGRAFASRAPASPRAAAAVEAVAQFVSDHAGARRIGAAYLAAYPDDGDAQTLFGELTPAGAGPETWWGTTSRRDIRRAMQARAHADFATGDVVDLGGWQLARCEARLAALYVVTHPSED